MSTNIQVPNYPQAQQVQHLYQPEQQYIQPVQASHAQQMQSQQAQQMQPQQAQQAQQMQPQQVHYDNFNNIVNINKPVTFVADGISLDIMKECDPIHINTLINMGIKLAKDHSFYKQFLVNKDNYNLKCSTIATEENSTIITNQPNVQNVQNTQNVQNVQNTQPVQTTQHVSKVQDSLDFTKLFD